MENIFGIIANEEPSVLLKTVSLEIAEQLKKKINQETMIFVYESPRKVLKLLGKTFIAEGIENYKIFLSYQKEVLENLKNDKEQMYVFDDTEGFFANKTIFLYPIFSNNTFMGAIGLFERCVKKAFIKEIFKPFAVIMKLVTESLIIEELKEKIEISEHMTQIIEDTLDKNELIKMVLTEIKISLRALDIVYWKVEEDNLFKLDSLGDHTPKSMLSLNNSVEGKCLKDDENFLIIGYNKLKNMELPFENKIKSSIYVPLKVDGEKIGVIALYNRIDENNYKTYKNFDELDLKFLIDASRRFCLALSRINYYNKLKSEIEKLKSLKNSHEALIKLQKEHLDKMNSLHKISQAVRSTYDKNNAIKITLLGLTSGRGLRYNRALYLERDRVRGFLIPKLWLGPDEDEDVENIWKEANRRSLKYGDLVQYLREESLQLPSNNKLTLTLENKLLAYKGHPVLERVVNKKQIIHVVPHMLKIKKEELEDIHDIVKCDEFLIFPITGKFDTKGVIIIDNKINNVPITNIDIEIIRLFQDSIGLAFEMIDNYDELREKTKSLEEQKDLMDYYRRFKENIFQNLDVGIIVVDRNEKIVEWNKKSEIIFSRPRENVIGSPINFLAEIVGDDIINTIDEIYETRESLKYPNYKLTMSNEERVFDIQFSPLWNREIGVIEGVIMVFDDVTDIFVLHQEMERSEKLASMGEMTARIAHEIRNPLTVIGGFLNRMLKKQDDPEAVEKYSTIIKDELYRLEGIVSEILEFSRGKKLPKFEKVNLNDLIKDIVFMFEDFFAQKNIRLKLNYRVEPIEIYADRSRLKQVIINLVKNAIEVVEENGFIGINSGIEGSKAFFEVRNNGEPISHENQEKLFLPFFTTKTHGTGLGLPICKKIIENEHKGKLLLVKSDEKETIFRVEISLN